MAAVWRVDLPQCFLPDTYSSGVGDGRLRSQPDSGPMQVRQRFSGVVSPKNGQMRMTKAQLTSLLAMIQDDLLGGSLVFEFPAQADDDPFPGTILARFTEMPTWVKRGKNWLVNIQLEIMP